MDSKTKSKGTITQPALLFAIRAAAFLLLVAGAASPNARADKWPGDDEKYRFGRLTVSDGLSHNVILAVLQDRHGFLWFGTEDGLNKYDGHTITVYRHDARDSLSLSDSWITALLEDEEGTLWIGTRQGGLNRFDRKTETFYRYPFTNCDDAQCSSSGRLNSQVVSDLFQDREGRLWIATFGGLSRLDRDEDRFIHYQYDPGNPKSISSNRVWCLEEDVSGALWVGTWSGGINRLSQDGASFTRYRMDHVDGPHISSDRIRALLAGKNGDVWIGTSGGGLNRFDPETGRIDVFAREAETDDTLPDNRVWSLHEDSRGTIWVGTYGGGLARFNPSSRTFRTFAHAADNPHSIAGNTIPAIYEDRSGILWLGGDRGASKFNLAQERHVRYVNDPDDAASLGHTEILSLYQSGIDPNIIWIGTNEGGLDRFDARENSFDHYTSSSPSGNALSSDIVTDVAEDNNGTVWIGTRVGLNRLDPRTAGIEVYRHDPQDPFSLSKDAILAVLVDHSGAVWVGTDGAGLNVLDPETGRFTIYTHDPFDPTSLGDYAVQTIFEDSRHRIWVGTVDGGLGLLNRENGTFTTYRHLPNEPSSLLHSRVVAIHEDELGHLWLGTYGGLNRLDPETGTIDRFTHADGIPTEPYFAIEGDGDGALWLTATNRLTYFNPVDGTVRHFTDRNGLSPNHYSPGALIVRPGREVILGGVNGLSRFRPPAVDRAYIRRPPVVITAFKKMDDVISREIFSEQSISLSYADRFFTFEFAVLDYTDPEEHQYQYQLEGYDTEWQQMSGPIGRASYANFKPLQEEYIFRVRAANSQGSWNNLWIRIHVVPPWWETLWFRISAFLALGVFGGSAAMYTYNRRARERAETLRLLTEGRERERQFLARELHDVPLQNLYSMRHKLEVVSRNPGAAENEKVLGELHTVLDKTAEDLRVLCGELRPPSLGPFGLEKTIRAHVRTLRRSHPQLEVHLTLSPDRQELSEHLRHSLFRIYQSALTNVLRHAEATALWVTFQLEGDRVVLEVRDNGRGFKVPKSLLTLARSQHFGLLGISEWAEAIEAELTVNSVPGEGTVIRVVAPRTGGPS